MTLRVKFVQLIALSLLAAPVARAGEVSRAQAESNQAWEEYYAKLKSQPNPTAEQIQEFNAKILNPVQERYTRTADAAEARKNDEIANRLGNPDTSAFQKPFDHPPIKNPEAQKKLTDLLQWASERASSGAQIDQGFWKEAEARAREVAEIELGPRGGGKSGGKDSEAGPDDKSPGAKEGEDGGEEGDDKDAGPQGAAKKPVKKKVKKKSKKLSGKKVPKVVEF